MKKLALLAISAILAVTLCVNYINKPDQAEPTEDKTQDVPTQVVHLRDIIETPEQTKNLKTYGGIAYDFENLNPIKTK